MVLRGFFRAHKALFISFVLQGIPSDQHVDTALRVRICIHICIYGRATGILLGIHVELPRLALPMLSAKTLSNPD